jgi:hypothetical protein
MAATRVSGRDRGRFARARGEARAQDPSAVLDARHDTARDTVCLHFRGGGSMTIPRGIVPGLVERAFGTRLFARATGQRAAFAGEGRGRPRQWCEGRATAQTAAPVRA